MMIGFASKARSCTSCAVCRSPGSQPSHASWPTAFTRLTSRRRDQRRAGPLRRRRHFRWPNGSKNTRSLWPVCETRCGLAHPSWSMTQATCDGYGTDGGTRLRNVRTGRDPCMWPPTLSSVRRRLDENEEQQARHWLRRLRRGGPKLRAARPGRGCGSDSAGRKPKLTRRRRGANYSGAGRLQFAFAMPRCRMV